MSETLDMMNNLSMKIILLSGDAHELFEEAMDVAEENDFNKSEELMKRGFDKLTEAHKIQTKMIQSAIEEDQPQLPVLFIHAQDTMMTIQSEYRIMKRMINLYRRIQS